MPSLPPSRFVKLCLAGLLALGPLRAGETVVTLKDGATYTIKTTFGSPVHCQAGDFRVVDIQPIFEQIAGFRTSRLCWAVQYEWGSGKTGLLKIDSPLSPQKPIGIPVQGIVQNERKVIKYQYVYGLTPEDYPETWAWLEGTGEAWIPFHLVLMEDGQQEPVVCTDWAKVTEASRKQIRQGLAMIQEMKERATTEITLPDGARQKVRLAQGKPVRYGDAHFQIDLMGPAVRKDPFGKVASLVWVLQGKTRRAGACQVRLSSPWMSRDFSQTVKVSGDGGFTIPFADSRTDPAFWRWVGTKDTFWMPVRIHLERPDGGGSEDITEVIRVDDELRAELDRMGAAGR